MLSHTMALFCFIKQRITVNQDNHFLVVLVNINIYDIVCVIHYTSKLFTLKSNKIRYIFGPYFTRYAMQTTRQKKTHLMKMQRNQVEIKQMAQKKTTTERLGNQIKRKRKHPQR